VDSSETGIATRAFSIVGNPNLLGGMLIMGSLISLSLALSRVTSGIRRLVLLGVSVVQLGGLAVTFSRGAWIGFVIGLVALIVLAYRRYLLGLLGAAVVVWFAAPKVFIERLLFSFSSAYAAKSMTGLGRLWRWESALQHIADKPLLGLGLGTFGGTTAALFGYWGIWVDNYYLQMAAEGGLLLLAFFLWLMWRNLKGLMRSHAIAADPYLKALAAGVFGAVIAIIVAHFFEADWEGVSVAVGFWFMCGLATSAVLVEPRAVDK
jgi:O-antigen ligase